MAQKRIVWSKVARLDFKATLEYYNAKNESSTYSRKLATELFRAIERLQKNHSLGIKTSDPKVRVLKKDTFSIFYELKEDEILVLIIWDSRRNPDELKKFMP